MLSVLQLVIAALAVFSALESSAELRLLIPLGSLVLIFIVGRVDKGKFEEAKARRGYLKSEIEKINDTETTAINEKVFFNVDSLIWPKNEFLLIDAVQFIFKDLGFMVSAGVHSQSVDRIVRIPATETALGLEILMSDKEVEVNHLKIKRALQYEKEKKDREKTLIIASTHTRLPLSERSKRRDVSEELDSFLSRNHISFMTTYYLYQLWQKARGGEINIFDVFQKIYSHVGGSFPARRINQTRPLLH